MWQAAAFLEGQVAIRYPVAASPASLGNWFFQDVLPVADDRRRPARPAAVPAAAGARPAAVRRRCAGCATDDQTAVHGPGRGGRRRSAGGCSGGCGSTSRSALATTVFFAFGTVFWYAAQLATTWYQAHIVAVGLAMLAVGLALGSRSGRAGRSSRGSTIPRRRRRPRPRPDRPASASGSTPRQFLAGLLFGLAATARLTVAVRRAVLHARRRGGAGGGAAGRPGSARSSRSGCCSPTTSLRPGRSSTRPTTTCTGSRRRLPRPSATTRTGPSRIRATCPRTRRSCSWPARTSCPTGCPTRSASTTTPCAPSPGATRGLFDPTCPLAVPRDVGMSVLLLARRTCCCCPPSGGYGRSRLVTGAALAVLLVVVVNLMHFSQGWVQFGYRFSTDVVPFALVLVALGLQSLRRCAVDAGRCRWRWPSSSCRSSSTRGASPGGGCSDGERHELAAWHASIAPVARRDRGVRRPPGRRCCPGSGFWDTAELQAVGAAAGHRPPDGLSRRTSLLGWLANLVLAPFGEPAFRMNLFAGLCVAVAAAVTTVLARTLTRSTAARRPGRPRPRPDAGGLGDRDAGPRPTRCTSRSLAILLRLLVGWDDARRRADDRRADEARPDRWLLAAASCSGCRSATTR